MNIKSKLTALAGAAVLIISTSCSTVEPARIYNKEKLASAKTAYVVHPEGSGRDMEKFITKAVRKNGINTTTGRQEKIPKTTDLRIDYTDRWMWDLVMYLRALDVQVRDASNGELLASGNFHQGFMHSFPDPETKAQEVVDSIFQKK